MAASGPIDSDLNRVGKTALKRIVSMLTRLIQQTDTVFEVSDEREHEHEHEHEHRDAEYEKRQEQSIGPKRSVERFRLV